MARWLNRNRWLPIVLLAAVFLWQWAITIGHPRDLGVYWLAGQRILDGVPIYNPADRITEMYKYSPAVALLFAPLSPLPLEVARSLWFALNFGLTLAIPLLAYELVGSRGGQLSQDRRFWVCAAAVLCSMRYVTMNAASGQIAAVQLALALGGLVLMKRGLPWGGGLLLSLAIMIKIVPVLLLGYLVLRRDWRGIAGTVAGCALWALLPALWFGLAGDVALHLEWLRFIQTGNTLAELTRPQNQSLIALGTRIAILAGVPLTKLTPWYGPALFGGFGVLLLALRKADHRLALVAILVYLTVIGPLSWPAGYVPLIVAWVFVVDRAQGRATYLLAGSSLALVLFTGRDLVGREAEKLTHLAGVEVWAAILLVGACFSAWRNRRSLVDVSPEPTCLTPQPSPSASASPVTRSERAGISSTA